MLVGKAAHESVKGSDMKCTMPKCRGQINGMTGLQELMALRKHFQKSHKLMLSTEETLEVRLNIEDGKEPNLLRALLGTERLDLKE